MDIIELIDKNTKPIIDFIFEYWIWFIASPFILLILYYAKVRGWINF